MCGHCEGSCPKQPPGVVINDIIKQTMEIASARQEPSLAKIKTKKYCNS